MSVRNRRLAIAPAARTAAAIIATAGVVLLAAACSGSNAPGVASAGSSSAGGSSSPSSSASNSTLAFSQCMRSHAVPNFPDPDSSGEIPKETAQQLGVSSSQFQAAQNDCEQLLANSSGETQAQVQQEMSGGRTFARCMRSHGVPNWPDPTTDNHGRPIFYLQGKIDVNAPQIMAEIHACQHLLPPGLIGFGTPGGVRMCPGDRPGPDATSACG